jgi:hypothetical protein
MLQGFQFPKTILTWFEAHPGTAGWMQAVAATIAIIAVYYAATIPVKAEARYRANERKLRADGMALLLLADILVLKGEIETAIDSGSILDRPVSILDSLLRRADDLHLLGDAGARLLQAMGMVNGVAAQTLRYQSKAVTAQGVQVRGMIPTGNEIWKNNVDTLKLCLVNLDEVIEQFARRGEPEVKP